MKPFKFLLPILISLFMMNCSTKNESNPLLEDFKTPYGTPPFHLIKHEHYLPAFKSAIEEGKKEHDAIINNPEPATFENTIVALNNAGNRLAIIQNIFFNLNEAETDEKMQAIAREVSPLVTEYYNDIYLDEKLFGRVKDVYAQGASLNLNVEQNTLLEKTYKGFTRSGANLSPKDKETYRAISKELAELSLKFSENILAETNAWFLHLTKKEDLSGLPASLIETAAQIAKSKNLEGWAFTLDAPVYWPFMTYSDNRELRKEMFMQYGSRAFKGNQNDNKDIAKRIANLRLQEAQLLGYASYSDYVLEERMAKSAEKVNAFLKELLAASMPVAQKDLETLKQFAASKGFTDTIQRWDFSYYAEKLKEEKYQFNEEMLKPYLQLDSVKNGIFLLCNKLYGLSFVENKEIPVYHPDVKTYEVWGEGKRFMGTLYLDFFPRKGKSGGAWMTSFRDQEIVNGENIRPHVSIVCNFTQPTETTPSLLTFNELTTFLHEFGHALHGLLSDVTYSSLSGTSVYRDFVELPSHIMENWAKEKEFLDLFAVHYQTGEKIPAELIDKIIAASNYNAAYQSVRQLSFGIADMGWHSITSPIEVDVDVFEREKMAPTELFPIIEGINQSVAFSHIFSGGYAAGYYGYKWAEVLDADAFSLFKKNGIFDKTTANAFRENILSKGGTEHPMDLYIRFRGQEPTSDALLIRAGLKK